MSSGLNLWGEWLDIYIDEERGNPQRRENIRRMILLFKV